jgi:hypothetical protein
MGKIILIKYNLLMKTKKMIVYPKVKILLIKRISKIKMKTNKIIKMLLELSQQYHKNLMKIRIKKIIQKT